MHLGLTLEQQMLVDSVRAFVAAELMPHEDEVERSDEVPPQLIRQIRERAQAAGFYAAAAKIQDSDLAFLGAYDPPPWWYPERRSLAAALLAAGDAGGAIDEARTALKTWPREPLTLRVLGQAERAAGQGAAGERDLAEARASWRGDEVTPARM